MHSWVKRVKEAETHPDGLSFTPPDPGDKGLTTAEVIQLFEDGKM